MANEFEEGVEEVLPEEFTDELKGMIIDEGDQQGNRLLLGGGFLVLLLIASFSWSYLFMQKTPEEELRERLADRKQVGMMLSNASRTLRLPSISTQQFKDSLETVVQVASTHLREGGNSSSPYIPERQLAMVEAIEALMRLELEGIIHPDNARDKAFFDDIMFRIGNLDLEYFEKGLLQKVPLSRVAHLQGQLRSEQKALGAYGTGSTVLTELAETLDKYQEQESGTAVGFALTLGKWFRYYNDMSNAERCFDIGQRYVEGYTRQDIHYQGKRPATLGPLWSEYAGCLEALAERSMQEGHYREARSLLVRMFNTPDNAHIASSKGQLNQHNRNQARKISLLQHDIKVYESAIETPLQLPSFPFYSLRDGNIHFDHLVPQLLRAGKEQEAGTASLLWKTLAPKTRDHLVLRGVDGGTLELEHQEAVITALNIIVRDSAFPRHIETPPEGLNEHTMELYNRSVHGNLSEEELRLCNRSLLDLCLGDAIETPFVLSDGTYLHSGLTPQKSGELVALYEELIAEGGLHEGRRADIRRRVGEILRGRYQPTLRDLEEALSSTIKRRQARLEELEQNQAKQISQLVDLERTAAELEKGPDIAIDQLSDLRSTEERIRRRLAMAKAERRSQEQQISELQTAQANIDLPLREVLYHLQARLDTWDIHKNPVQKESTTDTHFLAHLDRQIDLRENYLDLLTALNDPDKQALLKELSSRQKQIADQILKARSEASDNTGEDREALLQQLDGLEAEQHTLVQQFEALFDPIKETVRAIAKEEELICETGKELQEIRFEIFQLIGTNSLSGSLDQKVRRRAELVLTSATADHPSSNQNAELRRLNQEIADDNLRLSLLLQQEGQTRTLLKTCYPESALESELLVVEGELAPLRAYVERQDSLISQYQALWQRHELQRDISRQEQLILKQLELISSSLNDEGLSESQTRDISRYMQNIVRSRRQLEESQRKLAYLRDYKEDATHSYQESETRGFQIDTLALYQMEHSLGLDLNQYRAAFEERKALADQLYEVLRDKTSLEEKKVKAARSRDQLAIDQLIPLLTAKEAEIRELGRQMEGVSNHLQLLAKNYEDKLGQVRDFRGRLGPKIADIETSLKSVHQNLIENDQQLLGLAQNLVASGGELEHAMTSLEIADLGNLPLLISKQSKQLEHLKSVRDLRLEDNYYKAKALWLLGEALYKHSLLSSYGQLAAANSIKAEMLAAEREHGVFPYQEHDSESLYNERLIIDLNKNDNHQACIEAWLDALEQSSLSVLLEELPRYTSDRVSKAPWAPNGTSALTADINAFIAKSRFLSGQIHMKRAVRFMRTDRTPVKENLLANKELDAAANTFLHYLDFAEPLESHEGAQDILSEPVKAGQEFPKKSRQPIRLVSAARVHLGNIAALKEAHHQAIDHYREILQKATHAALQADGLALDESGLLSPEDDPLILDQQQYQVSVHPLYASLLAQIPVAHEALYRLGRSYQALAMEERGLAIYESSLYPARAQEHEERLRKYATRAITYYSQVILTQSYSPYRKGALLQRALLQKELGNYHGARNDLIAILGTAGDSGGSWDPKDRNEKGDLPGELNPGYSHIAFELGKLHLESGEFVAAGDAFMKAREGDPEDEFVLRAKVEYARTLIQSKNWLMAHVLLTELMADHSPTLVEKDLLFHPDILLDLGLVNKELGNYQEAVKVYAQVFNYAPTDLQRNGKLDLSNAYGVALLQEDFRDSIRPLALACQAIADICLIQRNYDAAHEHYEKAVRLFGWIPWQQDRVLRNHKKDAYESYRNEKILLAKWGIEKIQASELLYSAFTDYRESMAQLRRRQKGQDPSEILATVEDTFDQIDSLESSFLEASKQLKAFYQAEKARLPEIRELQQVKSRRERDRRRGGSGNLRYGALLHLRTQVQENSELPAHELATFLHDFFGRETLEDALLNEFVVTYIRELELQESDRLEMRPGKSNLENLLTIQNQESRLVAFRDQINVWLESEMRLTGLDDLYIPLSSQAKILEETNLYRVALLANLDSPSAYDQLQDIVDHYLHEAHQVTHRIGKPELIWQMTEIAACAAEFQEDWSSAMKYNRYLLDDNQVHFFAARDGSDRLRSEMALARALFQTSKQTLTDALFILDEDERLEMEQTASLWREEAEEILARLARINDTATHAVATKTMAKELLQRL